MPRLTISYSPEQEIQRVQYTLAKFPWYLEHGYHPALPSGVTESSSEEEIARAVKAEYAEADYAKCSIVLKQEWLAASRGFEELQKEKAFILANEYNVLLTKYGVGGSYNPELNQVIIKVPANGYEGRGRVTVHEIVHMTIQHLIDQYQVQHWRKERLVDLLVEHYFPGLKKMQDIKEDVSMVDKAFEEFFPNMEAIARAIGG